MQRLGRCRGWAGTAAGHTLLNCRMDETLFKPLYGAPVVQLLGTAHCLCRHPIAIPCRLICQAVRTSPSSALKKRSSAASRCVCARATDREVVRGE